MLVKQATGLRKCRRLWKMAAPDWLSGSNLGFFTAVSWIFRNCPLFRIRLHGRKMRNSQLRRLLWRRFGFIAWIFGIGICTCCFISVSRDRIICSGKVNRITTYLIRKWDNAKGILMDQNFLLHTGPVCLCKNLCNEGKRDVGHIASPL